MHLRLWRRNRREPAPLDMICVPAGEDWQDYRITEPAAGGQWRPMTDYEVRRYAGGHAVLLRWAERVRRADA